MDVPKHALRPTLLSALERIEALKEARKVDGEKIEMAIKELKESAKREQTLKNEIERLLEVERALKNLHAELKKTQKRHVVMGQRIKELEEENNRLRSGPRPNWLLNQWKKRRPISWSCGKATNNCRL